MYKIKDSEIKEIKERFLKRAARENREAEAIDEIARYEQNYELCWEHLEADDQHQEAMALNENESSQGVRAVNAIAVREGGKSVGDNTRLPFLDLTMTCPRMA
jgi:hypothetical protein